MVRPKGSKNRTNHKAGGDRRSKAYKVKKIHDIVARRKTRHGNIRIALARSLAAPSAPKRTPHPLEEDIYKQTQQMMRDILDHHSMPKGKFVPTSGIIDTASDGWAIYYDEERKAMMQRQKTIQGTEQATNLLFAHLLKYALILYAKR